MKMLMAVNVAVLKALIAIGRYLSFDVAVSLINIKTNVTFKYLSTTPCSVIVSICSISICTCIIFMINVVVKNESTTEIHNCIHPLIHFNAIFPHKSA